MNFAIKAKKRLPWRRRSQVAMHYCSYHLSTRAQL